MNNKINTFVNELNKTEFLKNIKVPILDGFTVIDNPNTVFTAVNEDNYIEQFLTDGVIKEEFETHIKNVIEDTKNTMREAELEDVDKSINYVKDYKNNYFDFKVYTQDNILNNNLIRQFNIYFMDSDTNAFFQVSLSSAPFVIEKKDYVQEDLTSSMLMTINNLMDHITK